VARLVRNLMLGGEFIMSHITHFYQLSALDYVQGPASAPFTPYFNDGFYNPLLRIPDGRSRMLPASLPDFAGLDPDAGSSLGVRGLPAAGAINAAGLHNYTGLDGIWDNVIVDYLESLRWRREALAIIAPLAGRTPQCQTLVAGGVACRPTAQQCDNILHVLGNDTSGLIHFIKRHFLPLTQIVSYLYGPYGGVYGTLGGMRNYDNNATDKYSGYGSGCRNFVSYGVFNQDNLGSDVGGNPGADPNRLLRRGYIFGENGTVTLGDVWGDGTTPGTGAGKCNIVEFIYGSNYNVDSDVDNTTATGNRRYLDDGITPWLGYTDPEFHADHGGGVTGYSWIKSPRILHGGTTEADAYACQVGPLARMVVTGEREADSSGNVDPLSVLTDPSLLNAAMDRECAGYKLGSRKSNVMLMHETLSPILAANAGAIQLLLGDLPGVSTHGQPQAAGFLCGNSTMDRHRARAYEALKVAKAMVTWANQLKTIAGAVGGNYNTAPNKNYVPFTMPTGTFRGRGMHEAPRGALSHWITVKDGQIDNYQCVVPTTWNASPRSGNAATTFRRRGPIEQAILGSGGITNSQVSISGVKSPTDDSAGKNVPVEVLRVVHSFDPCIACAVH
jgi:Ni,Fe-hydrogenase I large subunit